MASSRPSNFKYPAPEPSSGDESWESGPARSPKSHPTVYDAVAGRINLQHNRPPLRPDEILFKAPNAPTRYAESDYYFAHTKLPADQRLPSSDLLSAIHAYISNFYARTEGKGKAGGKMWKSMDETALIAIGILMEETAREVLGETGDLAFLEGAEDEQQGEEAGEDDAEDSPHEEDSDEESTSGDESRYSDASDGIET
ncbi:hypothetical protein P154DRAFT_267224 [Amniculicola lignicola CBS 123094]|uniref:Uncharacterized protein n=1 Tax=Amniculicola lignicola CBS 123094 TaxID=1392246 RepID=A0A6A5WA95_9PLEO|nr:hypothetical protein P154DRAFT_267224 [Amniculicola lignicola CBS 123094]